MVNIEVVYAPMDKPLLQLHVPFHPGATVAEVLEISGLFLKHPEAAGLPLGIFAKRVTLDTPVKPGDRIEIYRPLRIDPKDNRRHRAKEKTNKAKP